MQMKTILVVDDSVAIRQLMELTLTREGYVVVSAASGAEALAELASVSVDMVITDINMPNMDGIELIRKIRALHHCRFIPVVILTADGGMERKQEGRSVGATALIVKPFEPGELIRVVKSVLGQ